MSHLIVLNILIKLEFQALYAIATYGGSHSRFFKEFGKLEWQIKRVYGYAFNLTGDALSSEIATVFHENAFAEVEA
jgi:hypothetical protein